MADTAVYVSIAAIRDGLVDPSNNLRVGEYHNEQDPASMSPVPRRRRTLEDRYNEPYPAARVSRSPSTPTYRVRSQPLAIARKLDFGASARVCVSSGPLATIYEEPQHEGVIVIDLTDDD